MELITSNKPLEADMSYKEISEVMSLLRQLNSYYRKQVIEDLRDKLEVQQSWEKRGFNEWDALNDYINGISKYDPREKYRRGLKLVSTSNH